MKLQHAIIAALPGTMRELAVRTGVDGDPLWDTARAMREAKFIARTKVEGTYHYRLGDTPMPDDWVGPEVAAPAEGEQKKPRKRATILVVIDGWPHQDPGRPMVFSWKPSAMKAAREVKRLQKSMPEFRWSHEPLTATEAREIKLKTFNLREYRKRYPLMA